MTHKPVSALFELCAFKVFFSDDNELRREDEWQGDVDEVVWSMVVMETLARPFQGNFFVFFLGFHCKYLMFCFVFVSG